MIHPELTNYINAELKRGINPQLIRQELLKEGWSTELVDEVMRLNLETEDPALKKRFYSPVWMGILSIVLVILVFAVSYFTKIWELIDLPSQPEKFTLNIQSGADTNNSYFLVEAISTADLSKISNTALQDLITKQQQGEALRPGEHLLLEEWLKIAASAQALIREVNNKKFFQYPNGIYSDYQGKLYKYEQDKPQVNLLNLRTLAQLQVAFIASLDNKEASSTELIENSLSILKLGVMMARSPTAEVNKLVGISLINISLDNLRAIVVSDPTVLVQLQQKIRTLVSDNRLLIEPTNYQFLLINQAIDNLAEGDMSALDYILGTQVNDLNISVNFYNLRPNRTKALFSEIGERIIKKQQNPNCAMPSSEGIYQHKPWFRYPGQGKVEVNGVGKAVFDVSIGSLSYLDICFVRARLILTDTVLALRHYSLVNQALPDSLSDLVPDYLPTSPIDPFSGVPLRYEPERKVVYSVGFNFIDDGGIMLNADSVYKNKVDIVATVDFSTFVIDKEKTSEVLY